MTRVTRPRQHHRPPRPKTKTTKGGRKSTLTRRTDACNVAARGLAMPPVVSASQSPPSMLLRGLPAYRPVLLPCPAMVLHISTVARSWLNNFFWRPPRFDKPGLAYSNNHNFKFRTSCNRCQAVKPDDATIEPPRGESALGDPLPPASRKTHLVRQKTEAVVFAAPRPRPTRPAPQLTLPMCSPIHS